MATAETSSLWEVVGDTTVPLEAAAVDTTIPGAVVVAAGDVIEDCDGRVTVVAAGLLVVAVV